MERPGLFARIAAALGAFMSFRVAMALSTSVGVTAAVAGPLALEASRVRRELSQVAAPPAPTTPRRPAVTVAGTAVPPVEVSSTTTTVPDAEPIGVTVAPTSTTTSRPAAKIPAVSTIPTTAPPGVASTGLSASLAGDRSSAVPLQGAVLNRSVYVFASLEGVTAASFWLDDPSGTGPPTRTTAIAPFDVGSPLLDTLALTPGRHSVLAELTTASGTERRYATFDVVI